MISKFTTFKQLLHDNRLVLDKNIQRKFEWSQGKVLEYCRRIVNGANEVVTNRKQADCKCDMGAFYMFEMRTSDMSYSEVKDSFFVDEGGQRLTCTSLVSKTLVDIIEMYVNNYDGEEIISDCVLANLKTMQNDIKNDVKTENDFNTFNYILYNNILPKIAKTKEHNQALLNAYDAIRTFFLELLEEDVYSFRNVCSFLTETLGVVCVIYRPTKINIRLEKYNDINSISQPQSSWHRMYSMLSEEASKVYCTNFQNKYHEYIIEGLKDKKNKWSQNIVEQYFYEKVTPYVLSKDVKVETSDSPRPFVDALCSNELGDYNFFDTFFDDFEFYKSLKSRLVTIHLDDSDYNRKLSFYLACIMEPFINNKKCRNSTCTYMFYLFRKFMRIVNNAQIVGLKDGVDKQKFLEHVKWVALFRLLTVCKCTPNISNDDRYAYDSLLKDLINFNDEDIIEKHTKMFKKNVLSSMLLTSYQYIGTNGLTYASNGTRLILSMIASEGEDMSECIKDATNKFLSFNDYDIDHILSKDKFKNEVWVNSIINLRLMYKVKNRGQNKLGEERYIDNDSSFPEHMQNNFFTEDLFKERTNWIPTKIHNLFSYLIGEDCNYNSEMKNISDNYNAENDGKTKEVMLSLF